MYCRRKRGSGSLGLVGKGTQRLSSTVERFQINQVASVFKKETGGLKNGQA